MYTIGDKIMFHPVFMHVDKDGRRLAGKPPIPGRVVYIHPPGAGTWWWSAGWMTGIHTERQSN